MSEENGLIDETRETINDPGQKNRGTSWLRVKTRNDNRKRTIKLRQNAKKYRPVLKTKLRREKLFVPQLSITVRRRVRPAAEALRPAESAGWACRAASPGRCRCRSRFRARRRVPRPA